MSATPVAKQGHRYSMGAVEVLALASGSGMVLVAEIDESHPWPLGTPFKTDAAELQPLPMRYFHGETT